MSSYNTFASHIPGRPALAILAAGLLGLAASAAGAQNSMTVTDDVPSISVSYADLDLASEQGTQALYKRIVSAASRVCAENQGPGLGFVAAVRRCTSEAVARAVSDVNSPKLAEVQAAHARRVNRG